MRITFEKDGRTRQVKIGAAWGFLLPAIWPVLLLLFMLSMWNIFPTFIARILSDFTLERFALLLYGSVLVSMIVIIGITFTLIIEIIPIITFLMRGFVGRALIMMIFFISSLLIPDLEDMVSGEIMFIAVAYLIYFFWCVGWAFFGNTYTAQLYRRSGWRIKYPEEIPIAKKEWGIDQDCENQRQQDRVEPSLKLQKKNL